VGRNIAEALAKLGAAPLFLSAVGDDPLAAGLLEPPSAAAAAEGTAPPAGASWDHTSPSPPSSDQDL